ncbi:invasion protein regulator [Salmonella enterica subsp. arizonae]|uniref:Invasion protein regulator n=1 Tax=Salmonella enterica subsp. arizonae TaxID=59203 RepID=A0A2X4TH58_SALER|nr:invasion protein regulator [Salmonella enterica subsp. arizonae]
MDGSLLRADKKVNIPPKEYAVLVILLEAAGEIVSKNTLLDQVWGDAEVNEESLTRCIYALRRILSEDKEHRYIETLYGQGYRLIARSWWSLRQRHSLLLIHWRFFLFKCKIRSNLRVCITLS